MKRLFLAFILLVCCSHLLKAQLISKVDERFELTSIVFRLAGAPEYSDSRIPSKYKNDIEAYFTQYNNHELISYAKELRKNYGVSYNAISSTSYYLVIKNGKIGISPNLNVSEIEKIDKRWTKDTFKKYVSLLNDFYKKSKFNRFFLQHKDYYNQAEERFNVVLKDINTNWFKSFFGKELGEPLIVTSLCNGPSNYALVDENGLAGIVVGVGSDPQGFPYYHKRMISIILHELIHGFSNSIVDDNWNEIESSANIIFPHVKEAMAKIAYGDAQTVMGEWLTNLCAAIYFHENPVDWATAESLATMDERRGFIWMNRSVIFMSHFFKNRNQFKTIYDYTPAIIDFIKYTANNFDQVLNEYNNKTPYIVDVFPAPGSTIAFNVDTIEMRFSEPMIRANGTKNIDDENIMVLPMTGQMFWKDDYTFVIPIGGLEKGKTYGIELGSPYFKSRKQYPLKENYKYTFSTCD